MELVLRVTENIAAAPQTAVRTRRVTPPTPNTNTDPVPTPPITRPPPVSEILSDDADDYELVYDDPELKSNIKPITATKSMMRPPPKPNTSASKQPNNAAANGRAKTQPKPAKTELVNKPAGARILPKEANNKKMINMRVPPPKPSDAKLTRLSRTDTDEYEYNPVSELEEINATQRQSPPNTNELAARKKPPSPPVKKSSLPDESPAALLAKLKPVANKTNTNQERAPSPRPAAKPPTHERGKADLKPPKSPRNFRFDAVNKTKVAVTAENNNNNKSASSSTAGVNVEANTDNAGDSEEGLIYEEFLIKPSQMKGQINAQVRQPKKSK